MDPDSIMRRYLTQEDTGAVEISKDTLIMRLSKLVDYSNTPLDPVSIEASRRVEEHARAIYGDAWDFYSGALRREVVRSFELSVAAARQVADRVNFLEIGSSQGVSMGLIGSMLHAHGAAGALTSLDPYFENGYEEGGKGPWGVDFHIGIDKRTRHAALRLYQSLDLQVELIEETSLNGLARLIRQRRTYDLIYIDGSHEGLNPVVDFGLSRALASPGAIIVLDDPYWPDIVPLRELCGKHLKTVAKCWKIAAFQLDGAK
jgi:hypothetical protein